MKKYILTILLVSDLAVAITPFERAELFKEMQRKANIEDQSIEARKIGRNLLSQTLPSDPMYREIQEQLTKLRGGQGDDNLDAAIKFATGTKTEVYCRGVGLVHIAGAHNDGTASEVVLVKSNREMEKDQYSVMKRGNWSYEADNGYRDPIVSTLWLKSSSADSYHLREMREHSKGVDEGDYKASWNGDNVSHSYSTTGQTYEPIPMYMATDFHTWGGHDLGYKLKFEVGYKDQLRGREGTYGKKAILLNTSREVLEKLSEYETQDSKGNRFTFKDCFKVHSDIKFDKIVESK